MLQWFVSFPEFTEILFYLRKTQLTQLTFHYLLCHMNRNEQATLSHEMFWLLSIKFIELSLRNFTGPAKPMACLVKRYNIFLKQIA